MPGNSAMLDQCNGSFTQLFQAQDAYMDVPSLLPTAGNANQGIEAMTVAVAYAAAFCSRSCTIINSYSGLKHNCMNRINMMSGMFSADTSTLSTTASTLHPIRRI